MGLRVATRLKWQHIKVSHAPIASGGETISDAFGAEWQVSLGRTDADGPDAEGRVLQPSASPQEIKVCCFWHFSTRFGIVTLPHDSAPDRWYTSGAPGTCAALCLRQTCGPPGSYMPAEQSALWTQTQHAGCYLAWQHTEGSLFMRISVLCTSVLCISAPPCATVTSARS